MTKEEIKNKILRIAELSNTKGGYEELMKLVGYNYADEEVVHGVLDDLLLEYIGDDEITKAFESTDKWYG